MEKQTKSDLEWLANKLSEIDSTITDAVDELYSCKQFINKLMKEAKE